MTKLNIQTIAKSILESRKNFTQISTLLDCCQSTNEKEANTAIHATAHVFTSLRVSSVTKLSTSNTDSAASKVAQWLNNSFKVFTLFIIEAFPETSPLLQLTIMQSLLGIVKAESARQSAHAKQWTFDTKGFQKIVNMIATLQKTNQAVTLFVDTVSANDDLRFYTFRCIKNYVEANSNASDILLDILLQIGSPANPEETDLTIYCTDCEEFQIQNTHELFSCKQQRVEFSDCWLKILRCTISSEALKKVLLNMHRKVIPHLTQPTLLIDFLTDAYNSGGVTSLLSLNGLFTLIQEHNLDYPDFFKRLYKLLDGNILHVKYRSRFFRLLDVFLSSALLSSHLISAFIKKLARLCLFAPPSGILIILPFIYNLFRRHPSCIKMIHLSGEFTQEHLNGTVDTFDMEEEDPEECGALTSYLWEVQSLKAHYHPSVSGLARIFEEPLTLPAYDLEDFLDLSYDELFKQEGKVKEGTEAALAFKNEDMLVDDDIFTF